MSEKNYDSRQIAAVKAQPSYKKLLALVMANRRGSRAGISENEEALRHLVLLRHKTKAAYHNIAAALGHHPVTKKHWVAGGTLSTLVEWGVDKGLVLERNKYGTPVLFMKRLPGNGVKDLIELAKNTEFPPQPTLPGLPMEPEPAPEPEPARHTFSELLLGPPAVAEVEYEIFDPTRGVAVGRISGLVASHYTEHWITAKNDSGTPVRLVLRAKS